MLIHDGREDSNKSFSFFFLNVDALSFRAAAAGENSCANRERKTDQLLQYYVDKCDRFFFRFSQKLSQNYST